MSHQKHFFFHVSDGSFCFPLFSLNHFRRPLRTVPYAGCQAIVKLWFVADHKDGSFVLFQCVFQFIFRIHIKVVGRLVEDEEVGFAVDEFAEAHFGLLASRENTHEAFNVLGGKAAFGEGGTDFVLGVGWEFFPDFLDAGVGVAFWHLLLEIADFQVIAELDAAAKGRDQAEDAL